MTELKTSTKCFLEELIKSIAIHSQSRISKYKRPFIENIDANFGYYLDSLLESISQIDALEDKKLLNTEIIDATESLIIIQSYKPSNK